MARAEPQFLQRILEVAARQLVVLRGKNVEGYLASARVAVLDYDLSRILFVSNLVAGEIQFGQVGQKRAAGEGGRSLLAQVIAGQIQERQPRQAGTVRQGSDSADPQVRS